MSALPRLCYALDAKDHYGTELKVGDRVDHLDGVMSGTVVRIYVHSSDLVCVKLDYHIDRGREITQPAKNWVKR